MHLQSQFLDPTSRFLHIEAHEDSLERKTNFIEFELMVTKLCPIQSFYSQLRHIEQQKNFLYLIFFPLIFLMNSQINFKATHQFEKFMRYIHFAEFFGDDELCKCEVMGKKSSKV